jgi:uncharacterized protein with HEPN domain
MNDRDVAIVNKIIAYCNEIEKTHSFFKDDKELFFNKEAGFVYRNSITMPILQIGELAKNLSDDFRNDHSDMHWREIMGIRDIFAHHYGSLDYDMAWNTSKEDVKELRDYLLSLS